MRTTLTHRKIRRIALQDDRRALAFERKFARVVHIAILKQAESFMEFGFLSDDLQKALEQLYQEVGISFADSESKRMEDFTKSLKAQRFGETRGFFATRYNEWARGYIQVTVAKKVVGINATTQDLIQGVIDANMGSVFEVIAHEVRKAMNANRVRSMMIARTEVAGMVNATKEFAGGEFASETGLEVGKIWVHRGAKNPRDWHLALDNGEVIAKDDHFVVDDGESVELMLRPHDPTASAKNVVNCGCQVLYVPISYRDYWN